MYRRWKWCEGENSEGNGLWIVEMYYFRMLSVVGMLNTRLTAEVRREFLIVVRRSSVDPYVCMCVCRLTCVSTISYASKFLLGCRD